jgi:hypothetical protein
MMWDSFPEHQVWTLMSQRLQSAMLDISSCDQPLPPPRQHTHQYLHRPLQGLLVETRDSLSGKSQDGVLCAGCQAEEESSGSTLPLITSVVLCKQQQQRQQRQHNSQHLHPPHPLMPFLLEKVRAAACTQSETISFSHESKQQQHELKSKDRFKGLHANFCSKRIIWLNCISASFTKALVLTNVHPFFAGAVAAVIGSMRMQQPGSSSFLPPLASSPSPPHHSSTSRHRPAPRACLLARDHDSHTFCEAEAESSPDRRRRSDPGPPPNRRLVCVKCSYPNFDILTACNSQL